MIERKEQHPARNRESRQTTTTAESGGGGLVSVFAPPYGEDAPPAFHRYETAKMWTRGAYHRNEKGETWTRERGAKPQRRPPYGRSGARVLPAPCTVFTTRPKARNRRAARLFVWPRFGRIPKIQKFNRLRRKITTFAPVFGRFWRVFGRVLDVFGQRAKECSRAAETARRVCQLTNTKRPALFLLWRYTRRAFDMDETGAGRLRTFWYRFSYQKVNQTCTTWLQILYQIRRTEEGKARRAAFLVV